MNRHAEKPYQRYQEEKDECTVGRHAVKVNMKLRKMVEDLFGGLCP